MKVQEATVMEVVSSAALIAARKNLREVVVKIRPPKLPPLPVGAGKKFDSPYGPVRLFVLPPNQNGEWRVKVRFVQENLNPVIPPQEGKEILGKLSQNQ